MLMIYLAAIETAADKTKFEIIYAEYRKQMFYAANKILKNEHDSEDVVHQAFLKVIEIIDQIEEAKCLKTKNLVVTIVERKAIDLYRVHKKRLVFPIDEGNENISLPSEIENIPEKLSIAQAMAMLSPKYRDLLLLKYDNGYSDQEIAQIMSMTLLNVRRTIQRAKTKLWEILKNQEVVPNGNNG